VSLHYPWTEHGGTEPLVTDNASTSDARVSRRWPRQMVRLALKRHAPGYVLELYRAWREVWSDLRLYLATIVGWVPSHTFRQLFYVRVLRMNIGRDSSIHWRARFFAPERITIGSNTIIGNDAFLDGRSQLTIGNNVNISGEVSIFTREHDVQSPDFAETGGPVVIEDYAYVATRAMILPGVRVGRGAVVAAGAVVTKDCAQYAIVAGVPARTIGERTHDLRYTLKFAKRFQ